MHAVALMPRLCSLALIGVPLLGPALLAHLMTSCATRLTYLCLADRGLDVDAVTGIAINRLRALHEKDDAAAPVAGLQRRRGAAVCAALPRARVQLGDDEEVEEAREVQQLMEAMQDEAPLNEEQGEGGDVEGSDDMDAGGGGG